MGEKCRIEKGESAPCGSCTGTLILGYWFLLMTWQMPGHGDDDDVAPAAVLQ